MRRDGEGWRGGGMGGPIDRRGEVRRGKTFSNEKRNEAAVRYCWAPCAERSSQMRCRVKGGLGVRRRGAAGDALKCSIIWAMDFISSTFSAESPSTLRGVVWG